MSRIGICATSRLRTSSASPRTKTDGDSVGGDPRGGLSNLRLEIPLSVELCGGVATNGVPLRASSQGRCGVVPKMGRNGFSWSENRKAGQDAKRFQPRASRPTLKALVFHFALESHQGSPNPSFVRFVASGSGSHISAQTLGPRDWANPSRPGNSEARETLCC